MNADECNNCTVRWINTYLKPRKVVGHVEICLIVAAVFMIFLAAGTPRRRRSKSAIIRYGVEGAFILSFPLITYTLGLMNGQIIKNELYPVWAMVLAILFGGTNAMSVLKLSDNKPSKKLFWDLFSFMFCLGSVLALFITTCKHLSRAGYVVMAAIVLLTFKTTERLDTISLASEPSSKNGIKRLAVYMKKEDQLSTSYNPCTMQGYKYMVLIHEGKTTVFEESRAVTLEKIWCGNIGVLSSSHSPAVCRLKDVCLSFALFHLTVRRYFGYTCPESKLDKTRALVLDGLLRTEQDYERAFQVIEAELAFLYDFFFTKYAFIMYGKEVRCCAVSLASTFLVTLAAAMSFSVVQGADVPTLHDLMVETSTLDIKFTKIALGALAVFQFVEIWFYCVSDWAKVSLICRYVRNPSWQGNAYVEKLLLRLGRPRRRLQYWHNNIGQYSVLDSCQSREAGKPVELSMEVKKVVARAIKNTTSSGCVSNGGSTLMRHGMIDELCWACQIDDSFTLIHSILLWHVATCFCELSEVLRTSNNQNDVVATSLSRYCAYLVAFAPTLLPGSPVESECTLDELVGEAKEAIRNVLLPREKYEKLRDLHNAAGVGELLTKGAILGKALESMESPWDLLADFWAEMIVYVAPSDNVAGHIELLAQGGEFVTHVWALLMHAGILERPAADATPAIP